MDQPITLWQLVTATLIALAPYFLDVYRRYRDSRDKEMEEETEQEIKKGEQRLTETEKLYREWENLSNGYAKQIESLRHLETENAELRPLLLKIALVQQENKQIKDDKEDWKDYADRLARQLEALGHIPHPFRRTPRDGDTGERMKTISRKMKAVQQEFEINNPDKDATVDTPTVITPPPPKEV